MKVEVQPHLARQLDKQIARMEETIRRKKKRLAELKATRAHMKVKRVEPIMVRVMRERYGDPG